jgi:penicillin amidase
MMKAYSEGVNEGLAALKAKPWEYAILRLEPRKWEPEDVALVSYAMTLDLQDSTGRYVRSLGAIRDELGPASLAFFAPLMTPGDAALDGSTSAPAAIPPASEIDLRKRDAGAVAMSAVGEADLERGSPGSNSMAVSGSLAAGGSALVANDTHLRLSVPNIWYRMSLRWPGHDETGLTLPGTPSLVAGSTGKIAWGFTNSNAGTSDIIVVDPGAYPEFYHGPKGSGVLQFETRREVVAVRGSAPETMEFKWTVWGPVVGQAPEGRSLVLHWTADDPMATNLGIFALEEARDTPEAIRIAHTMGIPAQNFIVADSAGTIGWTLSGMLPNRIGYDGRLPVKWSFGDRRWDGFLAPDRVPSIVAPASGTLWTANNRTAGGEALEELGDAGYDVPARARQIEGGLDALVKLSRPLVPKDLLGIQLDDRALMLERWHTLLVSALGANPGATTAARSELLEAARDWTGRAEVASAGYRIVRAFRFAVAKRVFDPIFAPCVDACPDFLWTRLNYEQPLESLVDARPAHLLDPSYKSWDELFLAAADDVAKSLAADHVKPAEATWGRRNTARIEHPFARGLPRWAAHWLSMPSVELPGDSNMPRVIEPSFGASERFAVSPGHESEGIFEMPGGECANPLSPYFRAGFDAWANGDPTPFLPGPAVHTLSMQP